LLPRRACLSRSPAGLNLSALLRASASRTIQRSTLLTTSHANEGLQKSVLVLPRRRLRRIGSLVAGAAAVFTAVGLPLTAGPASATTLASFTFSGSLSGSLSVTQNGPFTDCPSMHGVGGLELHGRLAGSRVTDWAFGYHAPGFGTYKTKDFKVGTLGAPAWVQFGENSDMAVLWWATKGVLTITKTVSKVNITMGPQANGGIASKAKGTFQLRGWWDECRGEEP
jgi:hypothetical protein